MLPADILPKVMRVIDLLRQGRSPTEACRDALITWHSVKKYAERDSDIKDMLTDAQQEGFDTLADILLTIDRDSFYGQSDSQMAKIISENIRWYLARKNPAGYGDKQTIDVNLKADSVILAALNAAKLRAPPMLDLQATRITETEDETVLVEDLR